MRTRRKRTDIDYSDYADLSDPGDSPSLASDITDASEQSSRSSRYSKRLKLADDNAESDQEVDDSRPGTPVKIVIEEEMEPLPEDEDERYLRTTSKIAYISYFCDIFRFLLELQRFTAEEVEKELLRVEESILIADIFIKLLDQFPKNKIVRYVSLSNWEDVLRYHCSRRNIDLFPPEMRYFDLDIQAKVELIVMVCDWVFEYKSDYIFELNMDPNILRVVPLGQDNEDTNYWYFNDTRLYIERTMVPPNDEVTSQESEWRLLCSTSSEWKQILERLETSRHKSDKKLLKNFLPVAEDVISKLERVEKDLAKKEYFALLPKKRSSRIAVKEEERRHEELRRREEEVAAIKLAEERKKEEEERRRQELEERRQREEVARAERERLEKEAEEVRKAERKFNYELKELRRSDPEWWQSLSTKQLVDNHGRVIDYTNGKWKYVKLENLRFAKNLSELEMDMAWKHQCREIIQSLKAHPSSYPFHEPVDADALGIPEYHDIITDPMDLSTIYRNLMLDDYKLLEGFHSHMVLMFRNAHTFNHPKSEIVSMTKDCEWIYIQKLAELDLLDLSCIEAKAGRNRRKVVPDLSQILANEAQDDEDVFGADEDYEEAIDITGMEDDTDAEISEDDSDSDYDSDEERKGSKKSSKRSRASSTSSRPSKRQNIHTEPFIDAKPLVTTDRLLVPQQSTIPYIPYFSQLRPYAPSFAHTSAHRAGHYMPANQVFSQPPPSYPSLNQRQSDTYNRYNVPPPMKPVASAPYPSSAPQSIPRYSYPQLPSQPQTSQPYRSDYLSAQRPLYFQAPHPSNLRNLSGTPNNPTPAAYFPHYSRPVMVRPQQPPISNTQLPVPQFPSTNGFPTQLPSLPPPANLMSHPMLPRTSQPLPQVNLPPNSRLMTHIPPPSSSVEFTTSRLPPPVVEASRNGS